MPSTSTAEFVRTSIEASKALSLSAVIAAMSLAACNGPVENAIDCHRVCKRYSTCFDADYDVSACEDRCRTSANSDASFQGNVDSCEACISDESCATATFTCGADCVSVVP